MILLDSNILIGYLNGDVGIVETINELRRERRALFVSPISIAETLCMPGATGEALIIIEQFLDGFITVYPDKTIAKTAAKIRRTYRLDIPDAFVVATAIEHGLPLATRDKKMRSVPGIVLADI